MSRTNRVPRKRVSFGRDMVTWLDLGMAVEMGNAAISSDLITE